MIRHSGDGCSVTVHWQRIAGVNELEPMNKDLDATLEPFIYAFTNMVDARVLEAVSLYDTITTPLITTEILTEFDVDAQVEPGFGDDDYLIQIPAGVLFILHALFQRALTSPSFMPWIAGSSSAPRKLAPTLDQAISGRDERLQRIIDAIEECAFTAPPGQPVLPLYGKELNWKARFLDCLTSDSERLSPERQQAARWLTEQVLWLLIVHEVHHIVAGHLNYRRAAIRASRSAIPPRNIIPPEEARATEVDADDHAVTALFELLCLIQQGEPNDGPLEHQFLIEPWHVLFVLHLCINTFLFLFDPPWRPQEEVTESDRPYPTSTTRRARVLLQSRKRLERLGLDWTVGTVEGGGVVHLGFRIEPKTYSLLGDIFHQNSGDFEAFQRMAKDIHHHARENIGINETLAKLKSTLSECGYSYLPS